MKTIGPKSNRPKLSTPKPIDAGKLMAKATALTQGSQLNSFKKLYGNDRGAFLHKQATKPQGGNHDAIGSPNG